MHVGYKQTNTNYKHFTEATATKGRSKIFMWWNPPWLWLDFLTWVSAHTAGQSSWGNLRPSYKLQDNLVMHTHFQSWRHQPKNTQCPPLPLQPWSPGVLHCRPDKHPHPLAAVLRLVRANKPITRTICKIQRCFIWWILINYVRNSCLYSYLRTSCC